MKKHGVPGTVHRVVRTIQLSKPIDYEKWLARHIAARRSLIGHAPVLPEEQYILIRGLDDRIDPDILQAYGAAYDKAVSAGSPAPRLMYCDSDCYTEDNKRVDPQCKPDFDRYLLEQFNYIGTGFVIEKHLFEQAMFEMHIRTAPDRWTNEQIRQLLAICSLHLKDCEICHVPWIMVSDKVPGTCSVLPLFGHENGLNQTNSVVKKVPGTECAKLTVIIPNKDHKDDLKACIDSVFAYGGYNNLDIVVVENNSTTKEIEEYYQELQKNAKISVIRYEGEFNYSKINNYAVAMSQDQVPGTSDHFYLFLNNDVVFKPAQTAALQDMMSYAIRENVGAVGARLHYGDSTIQHAGVVIGYGGIAGHAFEGMDYEKIRENMWVSCPRRVSAVTAACMIVRADLFEKLGGFEEKLGVAYNDIDLCLRIKKAGYAIIYDADAVADHYESRTRGMELTAEKAERIRKESAFFCERWQDELAAGDPYYNPNLTLEKQDFSLKR